jgi:hypothetical protein
MKLAGSHANKLLSFFHTPLGEEVGEGIIGGGMAGLSQIGTDSPPEEIALKTAGAIAGGIGVGMLGRRIGAAIGKRINPNALKNQDSMLATVGRTAGSESLVEGVKQQTRAMKLAVQESLINTTSAAMLEEALANPNKFAQKYGVTADEFSKYIPSVKTGRKAAAAAEMWTQLPEKQKHDLIHNTISTYRNVEQAVASNAANSMDETIAKMAQTSSMKDTEIPGTGKTFGDMFSSLLQPTVPVTGEHVGRAAGRMFGDEIGVIGGLAAGGLVANQLGIEDSRDKKIKELQSQVQRQPR